MDDIRRMAEDLHYKFHDHFAAEKNPEGHMLVTEALKFREAVEMGKDQQHLRDQAKRLEDMVRTAHMRKVIGDDFHGQAHHMTQSLREYIDHLPR